MVVGLQLNVLNCSGSFHCFKGCFCFMHVPLVTLVCLWFSVWSALRWIVQHPRCPSRPPLMRVQPLNTCGVPCEFICMHLHNTVYIDILVTINLHNFKINCSLSLWIAVQKIQTQYGNAFTWPYIRLWFTYLLSVLLQRARQHIFWASSGRTLGGQGGFQQPAQQPRWSLHGRLPHERHERHERQCHGKKPVENSLCADLQTSNTFSVKPAVTVKEKWL